MDERTLIINALKKANDTPAQPDPLNFSGPDAIEAMAKRMKRREAFQTKSCKDWNNIDFLNYIDFLLKEFGTARTQTNVRCDSDAVNKLHDELARHLADCMSNEILKEYIEWWCSIWAIKLAVNSFRLRSLINPEHIRRFSSRYKETEPTLPGKVVESPQKSKDDEAIYDFGNLPLLLMNRGIVISIMLLRRKNVTDPVSEIQRELSTFASSALVKVMNVTTENAPYHKSLTVDFLQIAKPFLAKHSIGDFEAIQISNYFKG